MIDGYCFFCHTSITIIIILEVSEDLSIGSLKLVVEIFLTKSINIVHLFLNRLCLL